ncbi:MAG: ATP-binding cassette domain-containing protein [Chitinophagales bacterium]
MIQIKNLHASVEGKQILKGLNLTINKGEIHAIMGPNGTGKSTLGNIIAGKDGYEITDGEVLFEGQNILELEPEERARLGIFLAFQYPIEIPGVSNAEFLKNCCCRN